MDSLVHRGNPSKWTQADVFHGSYSLNPLADFTILMKYAHMVDRINKLNGSETIVIGSQQYSKKDGKGKADVFANAIKHDYKSKNPTTRWSDIIRLK